MLSYLVYDLNAISEIYPDLSDEDIESITDALESGDGLRLFQDGSLQDEESGEVILRGVDEDLLDEGDFRSEAQEAGSEVESGVERPPAFGCVCW